MWTISLLTRPGHLARPADHKRCAQRAFHRSKVSAPPRPAVTLPRVSCFGALSLVKMTKRVIFNTGIFDGIEDLPGPIIHFGQAVGPIAVAGFAGELRIWQCRHVNQGKRNIGEERLSRVRIAFDELHGSARYLRFHGPAIVHV